MLNKLSYFASRSYHSSSIEHLNSLLSRLNYLPGFLEAKEKKFIVPSQLNQYPVELIEGTLRQLFTDAQFKKTLTALENDQFSIPALLDAKPTIRLNYLQLLETLNPDKYINLQSMIKQYNSEKLSTDNIESRFYRS